ncbi:hypothetical protein N7481_002721 [Penicillium waksmanii]|uniref:uncharacterized protein n=1 Tax=Penicillium waksmanii TaxID=69791 RepID=UPI002548445E|nr:uncharacterized protein N7481_002721 [Penicillium waksmanii]KAJ5995744.1 hypothetical protein N7481_002721 [Penicillium waksmanii]
MTCVEYATHAQGTLGPASMLLPRRKWRMGVEKEKEEERRGGEEEEERRGGGEERRGEESSGDKRYRTKKGTGKAETAEV